MPDIRYGAIPEPQADVESLRQTVAALKQAVEVLIRQRKPVLAGAVTWGDLVDLGLINPDQVPLR